MTTYWQLMQSKHEHLRVAFIQVFVIKDNCVFLAAIEKKNTTLDSWTKKKKTLKPTCNGNAGYLSFFISEKVSSNTGTQSSYPRDCKVFCLNQFSLMSKFHHFGVSLFSFLFILSFIYLFIYLLAATCFGLYLTVARYLMNYARDINKYFH